MFCLVLQTLSFQNGFGFSNSHDGRIGGIIRMERLIFDNSDFSARDFFNCEQERFFFRSTEGNGNTFRSGTGGSSDTMNVAFGDMRKLRSS
ncbi:hypothetical protein [Bdellovibrio bacteriovorus]|uniref:hypothetical protein n=1 Tax=Bdellovibrio bacteriovorus TaxID=959 RepID=UPI002934BA59|nr:hypothetical protein [Bdellovibrio bacteriovorus]